MLLLQPLNEGAAENCAVLNWLMLWNKGSVNQFVLLSNDEKLNKYQLNTITVSGSLDDIMQILETLLELLDIAEVSRLL